MGYLKWSLGEFDFTEIDDIIVPVYQQVDLCSRLFLAPGYTPGINRGDNSLNAKFCLDLLHMLQAYSLKS